ncbi:MAG: hypothetical protein RR350_04335 [Oscillibacter sp.]
MDVFNPFDPVVAPDGDLTRYGIIFGLLESIALTGHTPDYAEGGPYSHTMARFPSLLMLKPMEFVEVMMKSLRDYHIPKTAKNDEMWARVQNLLIDIEHPTTPMRQLKGPEGNTLCIRRCTLHWCLENGYT